MRESGRTYLVMMEQWLVAQDIALTIADFAPESTIITVALPTLDAAATKDVAGIDLAFVATSFAADCISELLAGHVADIVLVGGRCPPAGVQTWGYLDLPFTSGEVLETLRRHAQDQAEERGT